MSRARNLWWGYVRNILREYPRVTAEEHRAVSAAIQTTRTRRDGVERMRVVRMTLFERTHTLEGAAACIPCSYATAKRWQQDFIRDIARYYRCNNGLSIKN